MISKETPESLKENLKKSYSCMEFFPMAFICTGSISLNVAVDEEVGRASYEPPPLSLLPKPPNTRPAIAHKAKTTTATNTQLRAKAKSKIAVALTLNSSRSHLVGPSGRSMRL